MNVRFKMTNKGEVAILPRKDYEALAAKAQEVDEDFGTARLVARARKEIAANMPLIPKEVVDRIVGGENALRFAVVNNSIGIVSDLHFADGLESLEIENDYRAGVAATDEAAAEISGDCDAVNALAGDFPDDRKRIQIEHHDFAVMRNIQPASFRVRG